MNTSKIAKAMTTSLRTPGVNPGLIASEEDFALMQRLFLASGSSKGIYAFSSVEPGNGCTWVIARAARALASHTPQSTCVVDANFRSPALHRSFGVNGQKGFAQTILQSAPIKSVAQQVAGTSLWVVPAGSNLNDPYRLLLAQTFKDRIAELRQEFDYVLIDTPPASTSADASLIGKWTDGIVLVLEANTTRQETAIRVRDSFEAAKVPVTGVVLNKRTYPIPDFLYQKL